MCPILNLLCMETCTQETKDSLSIICICTSIPSTPQKYHTLLANTLALMLLSTIDKRGCTIYVSSHFFFWCNCFMLIIYSAHNWLLNLSSSEPLSSYLKLLVYRLSYANVLSCKQLLKMCPKCVQNVSIQ